MDNNTTFHQKRKFTQKDILDFQKDEERQKKRCKIGKHYFISKEGDVYCKWCGLIKGPSRISGLRPLKKGYYEQFGKVWGKG